MIVKFNLYLVFYVEDYEYPAQEYEEDYNHYDPNNIKYESEEAPHHFQTEEY